MKMPCLSIRSRYLLLAVAALLFGLTPAIYAEGLSGVKDSLNKGKINKNEVEVTPNGQPDIVSEPAAVEVPAKINRITESNSNTKFVFVDKKRSESKVKPPKSKKEEAKEFNEQLKNSYYKMLAALKQAGKKKKASPRIAAVRIGDDLKTDASIPAKLPEDFLTNVDTDELAIRKEISALYDSFKSTSLESFNKACQALHMKYYQTRPDICHLIRLIKADAQLKKDPNSALEDQTYRKLRWPTSFEPIPYPSYNPSIYEEYLKMGRDTEFGNELIKHVNKIAKTRQEQIKESNDKLLTIIRNEINVLNKLKADYEAYTKELLSLTHIVPGYTSQYENNPDYLQRVMKYAIDDIKAHYQKISQRYLIIAIYLNSAGQWEESLNLTKEFKDYFEKSCPYKFTIKFAGKFDYDAAASSGNLGNLKILKGDLLIDKDNLKWGPKRIDQAALECMSRLSLQNVSDVEGSIKFRDDIVQFAESNILDQEEIKEYKKEATVTKIYFTENEYFNLQIENKIFAADERICVRCEATDYNRFYRKPVEIQFNSSVSGRSKAVTIYNSSYAVFQPNETNNPSDSAKNLIEVDPRQMNPEPIPNYPSDNEPPSEPPTMPQPPTIAAIKLPHSADELTFQGRSISVAQCKVGGPGMALKVPPSIYSDAITSAYINKQLVRSYVEQLTENVKENLSPNSKAFLMSGGAEYVEVKKIHPDDELVGSSKILVKRVANWFVIQGHGSNKPEDLSVGEFEADTPNCVSPKDLYKTSMLSDGKQVEISKYSGMDVLIIQACHVMKSFPELNRHRYKAWRKVLPKGLILSYYDEVLFTYMDESLDMLVENLKVNPTNQKQLGEIWADINEKIFNKLVYLKQLKGPWSYCYIIPSGNNDNKNFFCSGAKLRDSSQLRYVSVPNPPIEF